MTEPGASPVLLHLTDSSPDHHQKRQYHLYGTRHSLSYLVANPLQLDKRQQGMDMIAQVQCGIRVFEMTIRLKQVDSPTAVDRANQQIASTLPSFFQSKRLRYHAMLFHPFVTTNQVDTNLCFWHVLETLNHTARCCAIAGLIVVVSFISEKPHHHGITDQDVQRGLLAQITAEKFDHLFIILSSDLPKRFNNITDQNQARRFFINRHGDKDNANQRINQENKLITHLMDNRLRHPVSAVCEHNMTLVWLTQFNPFDTLLSYSR